MCWICCPLFRFDAVHFALWAKQTLLCFHGEIKVVGAHVSAAQTPSLIKTSTLFSQKEQRGPVSAYLPLSSIISSSHLSLPLPLHRSYLPHRLTPTISFSHPLSLSLSPFYSAVKASSLVFQKIKTLPLSLYLSLFPSILSSLRLPPTSPLLSECSREMPHWTFPSQRSNRGDSQPVFQLLLTVTCESQHLQAAWQGIEDFIFWLFSAHANQRTMLERLQSALKTVKESKRNYSLHFSFHVY